MINDIIIINIKIYKYIINNCYYFAVKMLSELQSLGWLRSKKEAIINGK